MVRKTRGEKRGTIAEDRGLDGVLEDRGGGRREGADTPGDVLQHVPQNGRGWVGLEDELDDVGG